MYIEYNFIRVKPGQIFSTFLLYYRVPNNKHRTTQEFKVLTDHILQRLPHDDITIIGDLNCPKVTYDNSRLLPNYTSAHPADRELLEYLMNNGSKQIVKHQNFYKLLKIIN